MRIFFLIFFGFLSTPSFSQLAKENCRTTIQLDVAIDTVTIGYDSSNDPRKRGVSSVVFPFGNPSYRLRLPGDMYTVISFTVTAEVGEDIMEVSVRGNYFITPVFNLMRYVKRGDLIFFNCIKARHENGTEFTAKNFTITR